MSNPILIDEDTPIGAYEIKPEPEAEPLPSPGFIDTFKAGVRYNNWAINVGFAVDNKLRTLNDLTFSEGEKFNGLEQQYLDMVRPEWWPTINATANTKGEFFRKIALREQEEEAHATEIAGSTWGNLAAGVVNGVTSPWTMLPVAQGIRAVQFSAGYKSWAYAAMPGLVGGFAADELNLMYVQESRTVQEAATNVLVGTITTALLGATGQVFRSLKYKTYKDMIQSAVEGKDVKFNITPEGELKGFKVIDDSAGAQSTRNIDLVGESLYGWGANGEISAAKPVLWATGKLLRNPVILGTMSKSATLKKFTNDALEHNFEIVKNVTKGEFSQEALQTKIWTRQAAAFENEMKIADAYFEYLGIDPKQNILTKSVKSLIGKDASKLKFSDFLTEIYLATTRGGISDIPIAARESKRIIDTMFKPISEELAELKILPANYTPFGAAQHVMRVFDKIGISANKRKKIEFLVGEFADTNLRIKNALSPIESLSARAGNLMEDIKSVTNVEQLKSLKAELKSVQKDLKKAKKAVREDIVAGKYTPDMLVGDRGMLPDDIKQLRSLRDPIRTHKKRIEFLERQLKRKISPEKKKKFEAELSAEKEKLKSYRDDLSNKFEDGVLDKAMAFRTKSGEWRLKKPNLGTLKFRKILDSSELQEAAENTVENILGLSEEQLATNLMDTFKSGSAGTNPLMPRSLFISDEKLIKNGFLNTDIRKNVNAFNLRMSRLIEMRKYLNSQGYKGEGAQLEFLANGISQDFKAAARALEAKYETKIANASGKKKQSLESEIKKKRVELDNELKESIEIASSIYKRLMGQYDQQHGRLIRSMNVLKNWAYSTQLGALFLLCMQDAVAPMYRQGFLPYFNYGIKPFVLNAAKLSNGNKQFRESAQDIAIGIETLQAFYSQKFDLGVEEIVPRNFVETLADGASRSMGILNMASPWSDAWGHISATASQSRLIRDLKAYKSGTLDKAYLRQLQNLRLDPNVWGDRILAQMKEHGEELSGAWLPNWHLWNDIEAKRVFQGAVRKEVRSTNFTGGNIASYPVGAEPNGLLGAFLMYMGWGFNSTANYLLPILQRNGMDINKATGIVMMLSVSSLVDPLRQIADGKEPELEPGMMFKKALLNSGVLGTYGDLFNKINAIGNIIPALQVDRFKHTRGLVSFAPESLVLDMFHIAGAAVNNEWNKKDVKRVQRMIPLTQLIYLRKQSNDFIDSLDLPETRSKAESASNWR